MSKKTGKINFRILSSIKCKCGRAIKANLVNRKETDLATLTFTNNLLCYPCHSYHESLRNHFIGSYGRPRIRRVMAGLPTKTVRRS